MTYNIHDELEPFELGLELTPFTETDRLNLRVSRHKAKMKLKRKYLRKNEER